MAKKNSYDILFESLVDQFATIPNLAEAYKDDKGKSIQDFITLRISEINSFKSLFLNYYLPAAAKSAVDNKRAYEQSKYKHLINISAEDFKENLYETIRLGYIGMFHKYENFIDELIDKSELIIEDTNDNPITIDKFTQKTFGYEIKSWRNSKTIKRINWISNCNKHYDGYPKKNYKPAEFEHLDETIKLKLTKQEFQNDIELLIEHYKMTLSIVLCLALYKMMFADEFEEYVLESPEYEQMEKHKKQMEEQIYKLIEGTKEF